MDWILELDRAFESQQRFLETGINRWDAHGHGSNLRICCGRRRFRAFCAELPAQVAAPSLCYLGSGDFHHLSLALLDRITEPFNLLIFDNHPDWMRGVPLLHCGTWLLHAAHLPMVRHVFHVGGDLDFDNHYLPLAPWKLLMQGRIRVLSARRRFSGRAWNRIQHHTALEVADTWKPIASWEADLREFPLYVSFDKDVLSSPIVCTNWESGFLTLEQAWKILDWCADRAPRFVGMDTVGDWSPVAVSGWSRWLMHICMHPSQCIDPTAAAVVNQILNLRLQAWWKERTQKSRLAA